MRLAARLLTALALLCVSLPVVAAPAYYTPVATVAALKALGQSSVSVQHAMLQGALTQGDGGGGPVDWYPADTTTQNGFTVYAATGVATGRWKRPDTGILNPDWGGTGTSDDATVLNAAWALCASSHAIMQFPGSKVYTFRSTLMPSPHCQWSGAAGVYGTSAQPTTFLCRGSITHMMDITGASLADNASPFGWFGLDGFNCASATRGLYINNLSVVKMSNVTIGYLGGGPGPCLDVGTVQQASIDSVFVFGAGCEGTNNQTGSVQFEGNGSTTTHVTNLFVETSGGTGCAVTIDNQLDFSLDGGDVEINSPYGYCIGNKTGSPQLNFTVHISNVDIENQTTNCVLAGLGTPGGLGYATVNVNLSFDSVTCQAIALTSYTSFAISNTANLTAKNISLQFDAGTNVAFALDATTAASAVLGPTSWEPLVTVNYVTVGGVAWNYVPYAATWNLGFPSSYTLAVTGAAVSTPVDTTEDTLATITLPAHALGLNGCLDFQYSWTMTNSANNKTTRVYLGGTGGTKYQEIVFTTTVSNGGVKTICAANSETAQFGAPVASNGQSFTTTTAITTSAINLANATTLVITGQKATAGETLTLNGYSVTLRPHQ